MIMGALNELNQRVAEFYKSDAHKLELGHNIVQKLSRYQRI